ncbi:hypothetical protein SO802_033245 [Lithocarpus litseifolius]|uniref:Uncharacterized protein n=1 Tax=Lithocarpus litseifolius TaxID=425828 RepID=A0AAW2BCI4_9ROSI
MHAIDPPTEKFKIPILVDSRNHSWMQINWVVMEWAVKNLRAGAKNFHLYAYFVGLNLLSLAPKESHNGPILTEEQILAKIKQDVRGRPEFKAKFPNTNLNRVLYNNWGFNNSILLPID